MLCMGHSCSYGAVCERDAKEPHRAICVCHRSSCPTHARPVCGHNGLTYKNECHLRMEECSLQRRIRILSQGPCGEAYRVSLKVYTWGKGQGS
uniref:Kazal-like domain-containing protein n=1 Tax=Eptatretus burgeri TaxID=7764 RepID=A0A8C4Q792_EPTBU